MAEETPSDKGVSRKLTQEAMEAALKESTEITRLYANGFGLGFSNSDAHIVLQMFGRPIAVWNLSYTLAKTLSQKLDKLVKDWEKHVGHEIATTDVVEAAFAAAEKQNTETK